MQTPWVRCIAWVQDVSTRDTKIVKVNTLKGTHGFHSESATSWRCIFWTFRRGRSWRFVLFVSFCGPFVTCGSLVNCGSWFAMYHLIMPWHRVTYFKMAELRSAGRFWQTSAGRPQTDLVLSCEWNKNRCLYNGHCKRLFLVQACLDYLETYVVKPRCLLEQIWIALW